MLALGRRGHDHTGPQKPGRCHALHLASCFSSSATFSSRGGSSASADLRLGIASASAIPSWNDSATSLRPADCLPRSFASPARRSGPKRKSPATPITPSSGHPRPKRPIAGAGLREGWSAAAGGAPSGRAEAQERGSAGDSVKALASVARESMTTKRIPQSG
eukprot:CAMPEP_0185301592 /NCGR_PEP_ID=MMETSP1363-20130426/12848_1 /TAXON_ID=38817 /ORGANISM="Gephyrocapsa oceanica, Strain RCC1303" /LENGTH=161 /DNA_ID=CAMNT_0027898627 /DNA_START=164 /DNA_END=649 /DNA_ORIENTATION=+